jgi:hypothetical protein
MARRKNGSAPRIVFDKVPCARPDLEGPCHIFRGKSERTGYGQVWVEGRMKDVHRYVWELAYGPIPDGMVMDHQCRVRRCCNVKHLRVVTRKVNATENVVGQPWQLNRAKTRCPKGHVYSLSNTYTDKIGRRTCKACRRNSQLLYRSRRA